MGPEKECQHEMFVVMRWERHGLVVPLLQVKSIAEAGKKLKNI